MRNPLSSSTFAAGSETKSVSYFGHLWPDLILWVFLASIEAVCYGFQQATISKNVKTNMNHVLIIIKICISFKSNIIHFPLLHCPQGKTFFFAFSASLHLCNRISSNKFKPWKYSNGNIFHSIGEKTSQTPSLFSSFLRFIAKPLAYYLSHHLFRIL